MSEGLSPTQVKAIKRMPPGLQKVVKSVAEEPKRKGDGSIDYIIKMDKSLRKGKNKGSTTQD